MSDDEGYNYFFNDLDDYKDSNNNSNNSEEDNEEYEVDPKLKPILKNEKKISVHSDAVENVAIFPSGNLVSVSHDESIIIYNKEFEIIQKISKAHNSLIWDVQIKDEENFATCSTDNSIKFWKKNVAENKYILKETIENAHNIVNKILYKKNGNLISCSVDNTIKIWEEVNNKHQCLTKLDHSGRVNSILLCEDKNLLISSGEKGTKFWSLTNYECLATIVDGWADYGNSMKRIGDDIIVVGGHSTENLSVISINEKKIVKKVKAEYGCYGMGVDKEKGYFFVGGEDGILFVYKIDNYEIISVDERAHKADINGIERLKDGRIITWSSDDKLKVWSYKI